VYYREAPLDPISLSVLKTSYLFRTQLRQLNGGKGRNEQVNIQTRTFICHTYACKHVCNQCSNGGKGQDASKRRPTAASIYYVHNHLTTILLSGHGATTFIQRKPQERKGQNGTRRPLMFAELWRPKELRETVLVTCHPRGDSLGDPRCSVNTAVGVTATRLAQAPPCGLVDRA